MLSRAIIRKTAHETAVFFCVTLIVIALFEAFFVLVVSQFSRNFTDMFVRLPFFKTVLSALVGADVGAAISSTGLMTVGVAHPFLFAVTWAFYVTTCTRITAGEIDRGTADLLLSLPVSRASAYLSASIPWMLSAAAICIAVWCGVLLGVRIFPPDEPIDAMKLRFPLLNLMAFYLAIGGISTGISAFCSRRGVAVAASLAVLLWSFFWNFLCALLPKLAPAAVLGLLHFYRPLESVRREEYAWIDITALVIAGTAIWLIGLRRFATRDIAAA